MLRRVCVAALAVLSVCVVSAAAFPGGGTFAFRDQIRTFGPDVPISLDGLNDRVQWDRNLTYKAFADELSRRAFVAAVERAEAARVVVSPRVHTPSTSSCGYAEQIRAVFGPDGEWAVSIAWRESRCTPGAKSPTGCWGLFQLCVPLHMGIFRHVCPDLSARLGNSVALDASCNIAAAKHLFNGSGRAPWAL